jgi:hypothetical protein
LLTSVAERDLPINLFVRRERVLVLMLVRYMAARSSVIRSS